jgi:HEAT repeat protein
MSGRSRPSPRLAAVAALLLGMAVVARGDEALDAARRLDADDDAARAAAIADLKKSPDRDAVVVKALRDDSVRSQLGPHALEALADLAGELDLRFANGGLRAIVADPRAAPAARKAAARALAKIGGVADVSALGDAISAAPDEAVRALVAIGGPAAVNALRRGGGDDPPLEVHAGLAKLGDASGLPRLAAALRGPDAARAAALLKWATGKEVDGGPDAWDALLRRRAIVEKFADLDNDKAGDAVDEIAAKLRSPSGGPLADDLIAIVKDRTWPVYARNKSALALGLGDVKTPAAKEALLWACRSEHYADREDGSVRMYAADALARVGDLSCTTKLAYMLNFDEDEDRIAAKRTGEGDFPPVDPCIVRALLRIGCRGAIDRIIELLAAEYRTRLHRDCLRALAEVSGGKDFGFQPDAAKAERVAAVDRIRAWWREARSTIPIAPKADDPGWDAFRKSVDENIATLGGFKFLYQMRAKNVLIDLAEPAFPQLVAALSNENEHVRMGVADVLGAAALRDAATPLAERLKVEPNPAVRTRLLVALEICGRAWPDGRPGASPAVADAVRGAMDDRVLDVRIAATRTLGVLGDVTVDLPRILKAREEKRNAEDAFRFTASAAVLRLAFRASIADIVVQLRNDDDAALRTDAARALAVAGIDLKGYDADAPKDVREAAIQRILAATPMGFSTVPYKERK